MKMLEFGLNLVRESRSLRLCEGAKRPKQTINQKWIALIFCKNLAMTMKTYNERTKND